EPDGPLQQVFESAQFHGTCADSLKSASCKHADNSPFNSIRWTMPCGPIAIGPRYGASALRIPEGAKSDGSLRMVSVAFSAISPNRRDLLPCSEQFTSMMRVLKRGSAGQPSVSLLKSTTGTWAPR